MHSVTYLLELGSEIESVQPHDIIQPNPVVNPVDDTVLSTASDYFQRLYTVFRRRQAEYDGLMARLRNKATEIGLGTIYAQAHLPDVAKRLGELTQELSLIRHLCGYSLQRELGLSELRYIGLCHEFKVVKYVQYVGGESRGFDYFGSHAD